MTQGGTPRAATWPTEAATSSRSDVGLAPAAAGTGVGWASDVGSVCSSDEIVDTLGEGTFGKVVKCLDRHR